MAFRVKGSDSILKKLIAWVSYRTDKITDFNVGSATRTLLESVALQMEEFYYDLQKAVRFAIKNSGYHAFGFQREGATFAEGNVTIFFEEAIREDTIIKSGTQFHTGKHRNKRTYYRSIDDVRVLAGAQTAMVRVRAEEAGERGNAIAGEVCKLAIGNPNVFSISNTEDIVNGKNEESESHRELRFKEFIHTLPRGTAEAVAYGAKQVPGVSGVYVDDNYIGYMFLYVHDKDGNLTEDLKSAVLVQIEEYRSAGIEVDVLPIVKKEVDINIEIHYKPLVNAQLYDVMITSLIDDYIRQLRTSESLNISSMISYIYESYGEAISYVELNGLSDINVLPNELIRPRNIVVNEGNQIVEEDY